MEQNKCAAELSLFCLFVAVVFIYLLHYLGHERLKERHTRLGHLGPQDLGLDDLLHCLSSRAGICSRHDWDKALLHSSVLEISFCFHDLELRLIPP